MENKYFSLGTSENKGFVRIIQIVFGLLCIAVSIFWLIFNIRTSKAGGTLWITIIFLSGFGFYLIWAGLGRTTRFIEIGHNNIRLKKNSLLSAIEIRATDIERIEFLPLNIIFLLKSKKRILLRFGTTYYETNEKVKNEVLSFAGSNKIPLEIIQEEL